MKNLIKNIILTTLIIGANVSAQLVGTGFNYQGQLHFNGAPVNTSQVFTLRLFDAATGGAQVGSSVIRGGAIPPLIPETGIPVDNGLFNLSNIDFGDQYSGDELWLEVTVKALTPIVCGGVFPPCPTPVTLSPRQRINAVPYAVQAEFAGGGASPWTVSGSDINFTTGDVTIGSQTSSALLTLGVANSSGGDLIRARIGSDTAFYVDDNGGVGVGSWVTPPVEGLHVEGDVKQPLTSNGMIKYMVHTSCGNSGSSIVKAYNGVNNGAAITVSDAIQSGRCVITFPDNISARYYQVSPLFGSPGRAASCRFSGTNDLRCVRYNPSTLSGLNGEIMILVY